MTNFKTFEKKLSKLKFQYIVNLSGYIDHSKFNENGRNIINSHFISIVNLMTIIDISKVKMFLQVGTSDEYGNTKSPQTEKKIDKIYSTYSFAKMTSLNFLKMLNLTQGLRFVYVRLFLVFGPGQKNDRLIPYVIENCIKNKSFNISSGAQLRDFSYVDDIVNGLLKILLNSRVNNKIFNLASGKPISVRELVNLIQDKIGYGKPMFGRYKKIKKENVSLYASIKEVKKYISLKSNNFNDNIDKTISFYKEKLNAKN